MEEASGTRPRSLRREAPTAYETGDGAARRTPPSSVAVSRTWGRVRGQFADADDGQFGMQREVDDIEGRRIALQIEGHDHGAINRVAIAAPDSGDSAIAQPDARADREQ